VENSIDAVTSRDFLLEALSAFSILMTDLSRVAQEIILWSTLEFGVVEVSDEYASTSSIMPQKKNPVVAEIVRAKASSVEGELVTCMSLLRALPSGYQLDLQEATPHLWRACDACMDSSRTLTGMMAKVLFNKHRLAKLADEGYMTATDLADYLATRLKVPFRTAHSIVGGMVKESVVEKKSFESVVQSRLTREVQKATGRLVRISPHELKWILDPRLSMERRVVMGGPSPKEVARMLKTRRMLLAQHLSWVRRERVRLKRADERLKGGETE